jgi:pimeloyl-ACP methyl ester carboxylesterase
VSGPVLAHRLDGASGEVVLLLNGGMMTHAAWGPIAGGLVDGGYRVLGCDLRGQLLSPGDGHPRLIDNLPDLVTLLDVLGLGAVHVLGTSFGGEIGLLLAALHPERVRTVAAVTAADRSPDGMREDSAALQEVARRVLAGGDRGAFHDAVVAGVYSQGYRETHAAELAARRERTSALPESWYRGLLGILESIAEFDLTPWLGRIGCPALVVGTADDRVMPLERVRALAAAIPGAELAVHPTAGHVLVAEDPAWLVVTYRDFLDRRAGSEPLRPTG